MIQYADFLVGNKSKDFSDNKIKKGFIRNKKQG